MNDFFALMPWTQAGQLAPYSRLGKQMLWVSLWDETRQRCISLGQCFGSLAVLCASPRHEPRSRWTLFNTGLPCTVLPERSCLVVDTSISAHPLPSGARFPRLGPIITSPSSGFSVLSLAPNTHIGGSGLRAGAHLLSSTRRDHSDTLRELSSMLAPKRRIGGSGTSASIPAFTTCRALDFLAAGLVPFFLSLALLSLWTLCSLLLRHSLCRLPIPGRVLLRLFSSAPTCSTQAWDVGTAGLDRPPVLSWKPAGPRRLPARTSLGTYLWSVRLVLLFLGFANLPSCVWAAPKECINGVQQVSNLLLCMPEPLPLVASAQPSGEPASFRELVADSSGLVDVPAITPKHCIVLQAGFPTQHILVYEDIPCSEQAFLRGASDLLDNNKSDHVLHPTEPQLATNLASLVAVPDWLHNSDKTVYVLDFSFWHGPVYAVVDWRHITLAALAPEARRYAPVPWQVAYGRQGSLLMPGASVFATPGDVFRFVPKSHPCVPRLALSQLLADATLWDADPSYIPREATSHAWLALRSHVTRTPVYAGTSRDELTSLAAESFHTDAQDLHFGFPDKYSPLQDIVYQGRLLRGVLAAEPRSPSGARLGAFVFVDSRLLGLTPSFRYCPSGWVDLAYFTAYLALPTPNGYRLEASGVPFTEGQVQVTDQCTLQLRYVPCDPAGCATPPAPAGRCLADFGLSPGALPPTAAKPIDEPLRYSRESPATPDPEEVLAVEARPTPVLLLQRCHFMIFSVDFRPEQVTLELPIPCTLAHALQLVSDARSADLAVSFEDLLPVCPQPDESFGALVAMPIWHVHGSLVVIDARVIDGRLSTIMIRGNLNRSSLLMHVQIEDRPDIQIFLRGQAIDDASWYEFHDGELISIRVVDLPLPPAKYLADMLQDEYDWCEACPSFEGPLFPAFRVLSDGGQHTIHADVDLVRSFADFRLLACDRLRYTSANPVCCSSQPRVTDLAVLGQSFKAILVATERVIRLPTPPGRLSLYTPIAFLDCRRIFQGFQWMTAERGWLDLDLLLASYQDSAPDGYCPNVRGADTELRFGRPYLRISYGTLLTVTYVASSDVSDDSSGQSTDPMTDGEQGNEDDHVSPEPDSDEPALHEPAPDRPCSRSRSPPSHRHAHGHQPGTHESGLALVHTASYLGKSLPKLRSLCRAAGNCLVDFWVDFDCLIDTHLQFMIAISLPDQVQAPAEATEVWQSPTMKPISCKDLLEPQDSTPATRQLLAALRRATTQLGQAWRYSQIEGRLWQADEFEETSSQASSSDEPALLHFVILTPGYAAAHVAFRHVLPATLNEAIAHLQAARDELSRQQFPLVFPATPQPCPGSGVVIAVPEWCSDLPGGQCFLCLDLTAFDGRLMTSASPTYVSRRHLLHLADLPLDSEVAVHMKDDPWPLPGNLQFHVATGDTFLYLPPGSVAPTLHTLAQELLTRDAWSRALTAPLGATHDHFCLVHGNETVLCLLSTESPTTLHSQIAACIGSNRRSLRLFPSDPRVTDVALHGVPCRGVISVCVPPGPMQTSFHGVLIDARGLLAGWRTYHAVAGRFSCNRALIDLQRDLPAGWRAAFATVPFGVDLIDTTPGQVLLAIAERITYVPSRHSSTDVTSNDTTAADGATAPGPPTGNRDTGPLQISEDTDQADDDLAETVDASSPHPATATAAEEHFHGCVFLILGQNYLPELLEVRLPEDVEVDRALELVSAARNPRDTFALPALRPVNPQPSSTHALLLAAPAWPISGALVAFDCRRIGGSAFALHLFGHFTRRDLIRAARIDESFPGEVYVGSLPWPLIGDAVVTLEAGDLVLFQPPLAQHHIVASLADMLQHTRGWLPGYDPAEDFPVLAGHHAWIIGDQDSFLFHVLPDRRPLFRADVARLLSVNGDGVSFQLAQQPIADFVHRGVPAQAILAASLEQSRVRTSHGEAVTCFIDARPLLLTIDRVPCPFGILDTTEVAARYSPRCPAGWELALFRSDMRREPLGLSVPVAPGEVLVVCFCPIQRGPGSPLPPPGSDQDDDDADSDPDDDGGHLPGDLMLRPGPSAETPSDTGGTGPTPQSGRNPPTPHRNRPFSVPSPRTQAAQLNRSSFRRKRPAFCVRSYCLLAFGLLMWSAGFHVLDARLAGLHP